MLEEYNLEEDNDYGENLTFSEYLFGDYASDKIEMYNWEER